jgi:hypothetical protein
MWALRQRLLRTHLLEHQIRPLAPTWVNTQGSSTKNDSPMCTKGARRRTITEQRACKVLTTFSPQETHCGMLRQARKHTYGKCRGQQGSTLRLLSSPPSTPGA